MSKILVPVDVANKRVQFIVDDKCTGLIVNISGDQGAVKLSTATSVKIELNRKGYVAQTLVEATGAELQTVLNNVKDSNFENYIPISLGSDVGLSDTTYVTITVVFASSITTFEYEKVLTGGNSKIPFHYKAVDIDTNKDVDTSLYPLILVDASKITSVSGNSSIGVFSQPVQYLAMNQKKTAYVKLLTENNQSVHFEANGVGRVYLVQF